MQAMMQLHLNCVCILKLIDGDVFITFLAFMQDIGV